MSNHSVRLRYNENETTTNKVHDKDVPGVPINTRMLEHIGKNSPVDTDVGYTELQRDIIDEAHSKLYQRRQHDIRTDLPEDGYDPIKLAHPLGVSVVQSHGDKGFDYRDFPKNIMQDHENFDPYIQYLHENGLIGLNKTRYITSYVNIDSRDRNRFPCTKNAEPIRLDPNPLSFNGDILRIDVTELDQKVLNQFTPGAKIIIRGLEEFQYTLRSSVADNFGTLVDSFVFDDATQYMKVESNNNIDVQTGNIAERKDEYSDIKVRFEGFQGDQRKEYFFDFSNFIVSTAPDVNNPENTVYTIEEDIKGDILYKVGIFVVDPTGLVIEDKTERPFTDIITWINAPATTVMFNPGFFSQVELQLQTLPPPSMPTTFIEYIRYLEEMQNIIRTIINNFYNTVGTAFRKSYDDVSESYQITVRFVLDQLTTCVNTSRLGNIPVNYLNSTHNIFFTASDVDANIAKEELTEDIPSSSDFFIQLDREFQTNPFVSEFPNSGSVLKITTYTRQLSDVLVAFRHYGGVPIRSINAEYPLGPNSDAGFRFVRDLITIGDREFVLIELSRSGYLNRAFGGDCITLAFVESEESGSLQPNSYTVEFGRVYYRVALVKMVSSQFPITQKAFTDGITGGTRNNRFYWQNLNDGDVLYMIEVDPGDYTPAELKTELEAKTRGVERFDQDIALGIPNVFTFDIDPNTNLVTIASFNEYNSQAEPVVKVDSFPNINTMGSPENLDPENAYYVFPLGGFYTDFPNAQTACNCYRLKIFQPDHGLSRFDQVTIDSTINVLTINPSYLNRTHIVTQVIDFDNYDIVIDNVNDEIFPNPAALGGFNVNIRTPNVFRIRFDQPDTIGTQLGFRSAGIDTSITPYQTVITNDVLYDEESLSDVLTLLNSNLDVSEIDPASVAIRDSVNLVGPSYLLIKCVELPNILGRGTVKDIFYKINLNDNSRNSGTDDRRNPIAYDSYSRTPIFFNEPLRRLESLTLEFTTPDGELYDFNGQDHSFVLEIVTYEEIPEATSLQKH